MGGYTFFCGVSAGCSGETGGRFQLKNNLKEDGMRMFHAYFM